jgi:predicted AAA+ superfamily ATPase
MKDRIIASKILEFAKTYPVVTITGPRQSGKTTLAKMLFPSYRYVNLESLTDREFAQTDPVSFLRQFESDNVIIDEVQRVPEISTSDLSRRQNSISWMLDWLATFSA